MELATSKADWIANNGDPITIIRGSGNVNTTGRIMAMKRRTGFFSINYLRSALFAPSSGVQRGDLILNNATGEQFFVEGFQIKTRQGIETSLNAELYAVNYPSVTIQRYQKTYDTSGNAVGSTWGAVGTVPMNVEHKSGNTPFKDGLLLATTVFLLTFQTTVTVQLEDQVLIDGRGYKVDDINLSVIPGLQVVQVSVDTRK